MTVIRIGGIELTQDEARDLYDSGRRYLISYNTITEMTYDAKTDCFGGKVICRKPKGQKLGFTRRGRFYSFTKEEIDGFLKGVLR